MDGWKMTGHRFRIDSTEFRRTVTGNTQQYIFHDFGIFEKSNMVIGDLSCLQIDPQWSLDAPWVLLDAPKIESGKHEHLKICEDARRKIIEIGLVEILST